MTSPHFVPHEGIDVLVVDARPEDYRQLAVAAADRRLVMFEALDGHAALRLASRTSVAAWLANMSLPDMKGIELLQLIRARRPDAFCVLVSDAYSPQDELAARTACASAYLCKPADGAWLSLCRHQVSRAAIRKGAPQTFG